MEPISFRRALQTKSIWYRLKQFLNFQAKQSIKKIYHRGFANKRNQKIFLKKKKFCTVHPSNPIIVTPQSAEYHQKLQKYFWNFQKQTKVNLDYLTYRFLLFLKAFLNVDRACELFYSDKTNLINLVETIS